jgi:hypothetical protein
MDLDIKRFDAPDVTRRFPFGTFDVVRMDDGHEFEVAVGDLFTIPGGHDSWAIGDEPYVSLHCLGAEEYAAK